MTVTISGCSTLEGFGRDMQNLGQGVNNSTSATKQSQPDQAPNSSGAVVTPIK